MYFSKLAPHGLWLPLLFMAICTLFPWLGACALSGLPLWTISIVFFGVLCMSDGRPTGVEAASGLAILAGLCILSPVLTWGAGILLHIDPSIRALMVLAACAPVAQSVGALAAILKLPDRSAAIAALCSDLLAPVVLPMAGYLLIQNVLPVSTQTLMVRVAYLMMVPAVVAFILRAVMPARVAALRADFRGMVIIALCMFAAARGPSLRLGIAEPILAAKLVLMAFIVTFCGMLAGWLACLWSSREMALSGAFAVAMRNVPTVWAALGNSLSSEGTLFMTLNVIPFHTTPFLMRQLIHWSGFSRSAERVG